MEAKLISVNRKLTKHNIRKFDIYGPCEHVAMTVCESICLDSSCIFCHVSLISAGPHEVILIRLFVQPILILHVFLYQCIFSASFTVCLNNILAVDLFSYVGLHDT